jgi:hypothetical protein
MKVNIETPIFDADFWEWKALEDFVAFKDMYNYVHNQDAMRTYIESMEVMSIGVGEVTEDIRRKFCNEAEHHIKNALEHFSSQTVVSFCTTFEASAKQFFKCLFCKYPLYMHDYIGNDNRKGTVVLRDVIKAGDYSVLLDNLTENASSVASKGKYGDIIERAAKLCKTEYDCNIRELLNILQNQRNKIVHEKYLASSELDELQRMQSIVAKAIEFLMRFAIIKDIPGKYSYGNPLHLDIYADSVK